MKKWMKTTLLVAVIAAFALLCGCGKKKAPADTPEGMVEGLLKAAQATDLDTAEEYTSDAEWDAQLKEMLTIDAWKNIIPVNAAKMTYEISGTQEGEGKTTLVTAKIKYLDCTLLYNQAMNEFFTKALNMVSQSEDSVSDEQVIQMLDEILQEKMKNMEETYVEKDVVFTCDNKDGYRIRQVSEPLAGIISCNLTEIADELGENVDTSMDAADGSATAAPDEQSSEETPATDAATAE